MITFEPMNANHLEAIMALEVLAFAVPWSRTMFEEELKNPMAHYYVVQLDHHLVGYAGMWKILDEGHITNIAVSGAWRNRGVGKRLLEHLLEQGQKLGIRSFTLEVRAGNAPALALYVACGFKAVGVRKKYYSDNGEDAVIMWRAYEQEDR